MRTRKTITPGAESGLSFEQAIERLEKIVADMESEELPLEDLLKKYEEGTRLARLCGQKLEEAEKKIEILSRQSNGEVELKPFVPSDTTKPEEGPSLL